jgi:hypothetical protein
MKPEYEAAWVLFWKAQLRDDEGALLRPSPVPAYSQRLRVICTRYLADDPLTSDEVADAVEALCEALRFARPDAVERRVLLRAKAWLGLAAKVEATGTPSLGANQRGPV